MEHPELPSIQSRIQILLNQASVNVQPRKQTLDGTSIVQETLQLYQKKYAGETLPDKKQYIATGGVKESHDLAPPNPIKTSISHLPEYAAIKDKSLEHLNVADQAHSSPEHAERLRKQRANSRKQLNSQSVSPQRQFLEKNKAKALYDSAGERFEGKILEPSGKRDNVTIEGQTDLQIVSDNNSHQVGQPESRSPANQSSLKGVVDRLSDSETFGDLSTATTEDRNIPSVNDKEQIMNSQNLGGPIDFDEARAETPQTSGMLEKEAEEQLLSISKIRNTRKDTISESSSPFAVTPTNTSRRSTLEATNAENVVKLISSSLDPVAESHITSDHSKTTDGAEDRLKETSNVGDSIRRAPQTMEDSWQRKVGSKLAEPLTKSEAKRQEPMYEFIQTQISFVSDLSAFIQYFVQPILNNVEPSDNPFSNIEEVYSTHVELSRRLEERGQKGCKGVSWLIESIADILLEELPKFRSSAQFCSEFNKCLSALTELKSKPAIRSIYESFHSNPYFQKLTPESYLLSPMQRVSKFSIMIKAILQATSSTHEDHPSVTSAYNLANNILEYINTVTGTVKHKDIQMRLQTELEEPILDTQNLLSIEEFDMSGRKTYIALWDKVMTLCVTRTGKYYIIGQPFDIQLLEFASAFDQSEYGLSSHCSHRFRRKAMVARRSSPSNGPQDRIILLYDNRTDELHELIAPTSKLHNSWLKMALDLRDQLVKNGPYSLTALTTSNPLPNHGPKIKWICGMLFDNQVILCNEETTYIKHLATGNCKEMTGFKRKRIWQMKHIVDLGVVVVIVGKSRHLKCYDIEILKQYIKTLWTPDAKAESMVGHDLPHAKNVRCFDYDATKKRLVADAAKQCLVYQYSMVIKMFRKWKEYEMFNLQSEQRRGLQLIVGTYERGDSAFFSFAVNNKFAIVNIEHSGVEEMERPGSEHVQNDAPAIALIEIPRQNKRSHYLMVYEDAGILADAQCKALNVEAFRWAAPVTKCGMTGPHQIWHCRICPGLTSTIEIIGDYVHAYTKHFLEIWSLSNVKRLQTLVMPELQSIDISENICLMLDSQLEPTPILVDLVEKLPNK